MEIIEDSAVDAWKAALRSIKEQGKELVDQDARLSREIMNLMITVKNLFDVTGPIDRMRSLKKWVYPELDELEDVIFKKEASSTYYYTYGARIFHYANAKDQIEEYIIPLLKNQPNTRRAIITLYNPLVDSKLNAKESPSIISLYFKIIDGKLTLTAVMRSNDMFIGWPANLFQAYLLQKYVANRLMLELGSLSTITHSAHIFEEYREEIDEVLRKG